MLRHYDGLLDALELGTADCAVVEDVSVPVGALVIGADGCSLREEGVDDIQGCRDVVGQFDSVVETDEVRESAIEVFRQ